MSRIPSTTTGQAVETAAPRLTGKRIAVIVFTYFTSDPRVFREATALAGAGAEVDLFCLRKKAGEPRTERISGVEVTRAPVKKRRTGRLHYVKQYALFTFLAFFWLAGKVLRKRYDLVHVHNMPDFLVFAALPAKLLGARVVLDLHDPMPEVLTAKEDLKSGRRLHSLLLLIEKLSIRFADLVLTPNISFRTLFAARSGPEEKIQIVMNSPLEETFPLTPPEPPRRRGEETDPFVLMYHGTLVERHGLHTLLMAVYRLTGTLPGLRLHLYGAETEYLTGTILPLIEKLGLSEEVKYFGEQPQKAIATAIRGCDLGIIPNLSTAFTEINFPTRIFEYLALGRPVIVPCTTGIRDYFDPNNMLFFSGGELDLAASIKWVFDSPEETYALIEAGQTVYGRHLWRDEHRKFLQLISHLLR
jgi:glycosyltransferase involved in cell wall biosynthesis